MSKKCCGILHSEDETVCRVCGKPLVSENAPPEIDAAEAEEPKAERPEAAVPENEIPENETPDNQTAGQTEMTAVGDAEIEAVINAAMEAVSETGTWDGEAAAAEAGEPETDKRRAAVKANGRAPRALKVMGILSIIMSVLGLAAVALGVLFLVVFPDYRKEGAADKELKFESDTASVLDAEPRPLLIPTDMELMEYFYVQETATGTDATPADALE